MKNLSLEKVIERHPEKVFRGTRVPLTALFENLKDGASIDQFLEWFPGVTREQVLAIFDHEMASLNRLNTA